MPAIPDPQNEIQERFNALCEERANGRPDKLEVKKLLTEAGTRLNKRAFCTTEKHLNENSAANPWHVCFAVGLCWGHLARLDVGFTSAAVRLLQNWNDTDLAAAKSFHLERGPAPIEQSLIGAHTLFSRVTLPSSLPSSISQLRDAQNRWLSPILSRDRPRYIGSWNATAMFMIALFAQPNLAATMTEPGPMLPPGGPIYGALTLLYRKGLIRTQPAGSHLDDQAFEPGALYENNALFAEILKGLGEWSLVDVHSGVYMLGTKSAESRSWI